MRISERARFLVALCLVSLGGAAFAMVFRSALSWWYERVFSAKDVVAAIASLPWWLRLSLPVVGGALAGSISSIPQISANVSNVMEAVALGNVRLSLKTSLIRTISSWTAIAAGMSIGREGPLIEFGGTLGARVARAMRMNLDNARVLIASGTAAGFAAAYNTPFAAVLFVLETIIGIAAPAAILPAIAATVIATVLIRAAIGAGPIYGQRSFALESPIDLLAFGGLAVLASLAGLGFKKALALTEEFFERHTLRRPIRAACGGAVVGLLAIWLPEVAGNGYEPLNDILNERVTLAAAAILIGAKVLATSASVGSGVPGGIFTPMLLVGAALGTLWGRYIVHLIPSGASSGSYALVGMAATTAASIHAPLTAAVMVFELSGDYPIALPLLFATFVSTGLSKLLRSESIYEAELRRRGLRWELTLEGRQVTEDS